MMKFVTIALAALSVGLASASDAPKAIMFDQKSVEDQLKIMFDLTPKDLKNECEFDFEKDWTKIENALAHQQKVADKEVAELQKTYKLTDERFGPKIKDICNKDQDYADARIAVIEAAIPCDNGKTRKHTALEFSKEHTC